MSGQAPSHDRFRAANVRRWDGNRRTTVSWDGLRKDTELWFSKGDCLVHFYERGQSKRGPSLRLPFAEIESSGCRPLLQRAAAYPVPQTPSLTSSDGESPIESPLHRIHHELYIPAPSHLSREEAFQYHLTTRNFFAWMFEKPLVAGRLGEALVFLLERMNEYRPNDEGNEDDILAYLDGQGYSDFRDCPDHALAVLQFAEKFELRELWTDAFAHCAGMNNHLAASAEFELTSRTSKALITRAHLEMDLRLEHAGRALGNFLEDELSGASLGLSQDARVHLERFRSFLHSFYVQKCGYWPPPQIKKNSKTLSKSTYQTMYFEIRNLYEYLADSSSSDTFQSNRPADGGICVLQNIKTFDKRRRYNTLPHALPLLPQLSRDLAGQKAQGLAKIFGSRQLRSNRRVAASAALSAATNPSEMAVMGCRLVREYLKFEKSWTMTEEERISCADARKVRWILVYAMLQTLISVTRAPQEVRDTEDVSYPLCCQIAGTPPWKSGMRAEPFDESHAASDVNISTPVPQVKPDVEYFTPKPLAVPTAKAQPAVSLPHKISTSNGLSLLAPQPQKAGLCEMLLNGYSLNTNAEYVDSDPSTPSSVEREGSSGWDTSSDEDAMEHASVTGSASFYGEEEAPEMPDKLSVNPVTKKVSTGSFRPSEVNPEVDHYIFS